jgi:hypothetical protein
LESFLTSYLKLNFLSIKFYHSDFKIIPKEETKVVLKVFSKMSGQETDLVYIPVTNHQQVNRYIFVMFSLPALLPLSKMRPGIGP